MKTPWSNPTPEVLARREHFDFVYEYLLFAGVNPGLAVNVEQAIWDYHQKQPAVPEKIPGSEPLNADDFESINQW